MFGTYLTLKKDLLDFDDGPTPEITDCIAVTKKSMVLLPPF
jgi:hypothetical protein